MAKAPPKTVTAAKKTRAASAKTRSKAPPTGTRSKPPAREPNAIATRFYDSLLRFPDPRQQTEAERRAALSLIQHIADRFHQFAAETAATHGLHVTDNYVLVILSRSGPECIAQVAELQRQLGFTSGGVTRCLDRMVASGLVERVSDPSDGRAWMARLTRKGRSIADKINSMRGPRIREMHAELAPEEWRTLNALLQRISAKMADISTTEEGQRD